MLKQIKDIKDRHQQIYLYTLQQRNRLKRYINEKGYVCYDTNEFKKYKKKAHVGRPSKGRK